MVSLVVKAEMLISVPGSKSRRSGGFTLLELMVVVAMIAITTAVVSFTIPDPSSTRPEREAARLIALLESARTQARAGAMTVLWVPQPGADGADYQFGFASSLDATIEVGSNGGAGRSCWWPQHRFGARTHHRCAKHFASHGR